MEKINIKNRNLLGIWLCCFFIYIFLAAKEANSLQNTERTSLTGRISDNQGTPLPGVAVELENVRTGSKMTTVSSENGNFYFRNIEAGEYLVTVAVQGFSKQERKVVVGMGQSMVLNFVLPVGDPIYGTIEGVIALKPANAAGNPLITLADENGEIIEEQEGSATKTGCFTYSFSSLSPGAYKINVTMGGFSQKVKAIRLAERQVKKQNFTLTQKKKK